MKETGKKTNRAHRAINGPAGAILSPLSFVYGAGVRLRLSLYRTGIFKTHTLPCTVISVGNITAGGAGKTPMTIHIAGLLKKMGRNVVVLSRGYKRSSKGVKIVSDGAKLLLGPIEAGDEPYLMARRLKGVPVVVGEDRVRAGEYAIRKFTPECILLDDGFQHIRLFRDLNILLVDSKTAFGNERLLPAGLLREPMGGVGRADLIMIKGVKGHKLEGRYEERLKSFKLDTLGFHYRVTGASALRKKKRLAPDELRGLKVFALAGVANPGGFLETLKELGVSVTGKLLYRDHHAYSKTDFNAIKAAAARAELIVTTEKDGVKLERFTEGKVPIYAIEIEVVIDEAEALERHLARVLGGGVGGSV
jgi:tetraacyldisaccharide 4'-kinase